MLAEFFTFLYKRLTKIVRDVVSEICYSPRCYHVILSFKSTWNSENVQILIILGLYRNGLNLESGRGCTSIIVKCGNWT